MNSLKLSRAESIAEIEFPTYSGCYVLVVDYEGVKELGLSRAASRSVLYVGKAKYNIRNRVNTHLRDGGSGRSTLRRSIGALLRETYYLNPQPRSENPSDSKRFTNYKFDHNGEEAISYWIETFVCFLGVESSNPRKTEDYLVSEYHPLLNLTGWPNPEKAIIMRKRAECVRIAKYGLRA